MNVEAEIRDLKRRVGELEGGFGFLTNQVRDVHRDLLGFQQATEQRFDRLDDRMDRLDGGMDRLDGRMDRMETKVDALPKALAETVREIIGKPS